MSQRIEQLARRFSRGMGDPSPTEIAWVAGRRQGANHVDSGDVVDSNQSVYLISVRGHFVDTMASRPYGAAAPRGSVLTLIVSRKDFGVLDLGVGNHWPRMAQLGHVHVLKP